MAADMRVLDVDKLLSQYKVSTALSAAWSVTQSRNKACYCHIFHGMHDACTAVPPQTVLVILYPVFLRTAC